MRSYLDVLPNDIQDHIQDIAWRLYFQDHVVTCIVHIRNPLIIYSDSKYDLIQLHKKPATCYYVEEFSINDNFRQHDMIDPIPCIIHKKQAVCKLINNIKLHEDDLILERGTDFCSRSFHYLCMKNKFFLKAIIDN